MADITSKLIDEAFNKPPVPKQRTRAALQGLTLGAADEMEAYTRAAITGRPVEEVLEEIRSGIKAYQSEYPIEATAYEVGGAVAPALFSGGSTAPLTVGRMALRGMGEGAAYAFNTGEGGFGERAARVPAGAVTGVIGGVIGGKAMQFGGQALEVLVDAVRRTTGGKGASRVEQEIRRLAEQTGKTPDQLAQDIIDGKIMAENRTLIPALKALRGQGGPAAGMLDTALEQRPQRLRKDAMSEVASYLDDVSGDPSASAVRRQRESEQLTRKAEREAYKPFETQSVSNDVFIALSNVLDRIPEAGETLQKIAKRQGLEGLYRVDDQGRVVFARRPTVAEAEKIRRVVNQQAKKEGEIDFDLSQSTRDIEGGLRSILDVDVPDLMTTRAQAAAVRANRDAFIAGRKALSGDVNEVILDVQDKWGKDEKTLAAFKSGLLAALQGKMTTGTRKSTIRNLLSDETKEGMLLRELLDEADVEKVIRKLDIAAEGQEVSDAVLRNTQTAESLLQAKRQGSQLSMDDFGGAMYGDPMAMMRIARKFVDGFARGLSDAERQKVASVLISEDADLVRRAITDERNIAAIQQRINQIIPRLSARGAGAGAQQVTGPVADIGGDLTKGTISGLLGAFQ